MDKNGYYKISRKLLQSDLWLMEPFTKAQAWLDLIGLASFKQSQIKIKNGEIIPVNRGECAWGIVQLAKRWQWSRGKVNRFFEYLKTQKMIQQKICPNLTVISILNYDLYQNDTTNGSTNRSTNGTHYKKEKKEEEEEILSLSKDSCTARAGARVGKREREILKSRIKRMKGVRNIAAYMCKAIETGDYTELIQEEIDYQKQRKAQEQKVREKQEAELQESKQEMPVSPDYFQQVRDRLKKRRRGDYEQAGYSGTATT